MADPFKTTRWSLVIAAGDDRGESGEALEWLCRTYWYPLYAFVRRRGHDVEVARDLTQAYFVELLERHALGGLDPAQGKFRAFLLASMKNFLSRQREKERAYKRHGDDPAFRVALDDAEERYRGQPADALDPGQLFDKRWALTVFERGMDALEDEYVSSGRGELFRRLRGFLTGDGDAPYAAIAADLSMSEGAVKVAVHRMRRRLGALLRREVEQTVSSPDEVDGELRHLLEALSS